jgi:hypothetical protein
MSDALDLERTATEVAVAAARFAAAERKVQAAQKVRTPGGGGDGGAPPSRRFGIGSGFTPVPERTDNGCGPAGMQMLRPRPASPLAINPAGFCQACVCGAGAVSGPYGRAPSQLPQASPARLQLQAGKARCLEPRPLVSGPRSRAAVHPTRPAPRWRPPPLPSPPHPASSEAASVLERSIAAIEAMITSRRIIAAAPIAEEPKSAADLLKEQLLSGQSPAQQQQQVRRAGAAAAPRHPRAQAGARGTASGRRP